MKATYSEAAKIVVVETDLDVYVETAANGGDNNNNGLSPSTPKLDLLNMLRNLPQINVGKVTVNMGIGAHKGAYLGRLINNTYPEVLPYGRLNILGQTLLATLTTGVNTGIASAGGVDSDQLPYFDKPTGEADWTATEIIGKAIKKIAGQGPNWAYVQANTGSRITLAYPYPSGFEIPNATFEFEIHDPGSIIDQAHPDVYNDASPTQILMQLYDFSGKLVMDNMYFIPSVGPNAIGIYYHNCHGNLWFENCLFDSLVTNYFLMGFTIADGAGILTIKDSCFNGVGKGTGNNNTIRGRNSGVIELYNNVILGNRAGVEALDTVSMPGLLVNRLYAEGGESLYRGIFFPSIATFDKVVTKNINGPIITSDDKPINIIAMNSTFDGGSSGIYTPTHGPNSAVLRDVVIKNMTSDGIIFSGGNIDASNLSGSGNTGYGVQLKNEAKMLASNTVSITGTSGDVLVGSIVVPHTNVASPGDYVTDAGHNCTYRRE